jgi:hypothetical protein
MSFSMSAALSWHVCIARAARFPQDTPLSLFPPESDSAKIKTYHQGKRRKWTMAHFGNVSGRVGSGS